MTHRILNVLFQLNVEKTKKKKEGEEEEEAGIFLKAHICSELNLAGFTKSEKQLKEHNTLTDENLSRNLARICASVSLESGCD